MDDLIRRSAANLLAISLALSADIDDGAHDLNPAANQPTADSDPSSLFLCEERMKPGSTYRPAESQPSLSD